MGSGKQHSLVVDDRRYKGLLLTRFAGKDSLVGPVSPVFRSSSEALTSSAPPTVSFTQPVGTAVSRATLAQADQAAEITLDGINKMIKS